MGVGVVRKERKEEGYSYTYCSMYNYKCSIHIKGKGWFDDGMCRERRGFTADERTK